MARLALITIVALPFLAACATTKSDNRFAEPNALMGQEIDGRIEQIAFQHREELYHNLVWLSQAGEQAIPSLLRGLHHSEPKVRSNSAWVLGQIGDRRVIQDLRSLANDGNETVRLEVSRSLVVLGDIKHCPLLIDALDSEKVQVRYLCHEALKTATGQDFGYDHLSEDNGERQRTVLDWRRWWGDMSGDPWFAQTYAQRHGLAEEATPMPDANPAPMVEGAPMTETETGNSETNQNTTPETSSSTTENGTETEMVEIPTVETTETPVPSEGTRNGPPPMPIPTEGSNGGWKQVPTPGKTTGSNG